MLPDLCFLRAIEPPIDDCVVQEAEGGEDPSQFWLLRGEGQVAIDTTGMYFLV